MLDCIGLTVDRRNPSGLSKTDSSSHRLPDNSILNTKRGETMRHLMSYLLRSVLIAALISCLPLTVNAKATKGAQVRTNETQLYGKYVFRMRAAKGSGLISSFFTWKEGSELPGALWEEIDIEVFGKN